MSKIAIIDGYRTLASMLAAPLQARGYHTEIFVPPIDARELHAYNPDLMIFGLDRRQVAQDRPIEDLETDVTGFAGLRELSRSSTVNVIPIIIIGDSIKEEYIPEGIDYDLFLAFPDEVESYVSRVQEVLTSVRTRHHVSPLHCPTCGSRLTYRGRSKHDLTCPKCHTVVVLTDGHCVMRTPTGKPTLCPMDLLKSPT